jgi:hypothetical protein
MKRNIAEKGLCPSMLCFYLGFLPQPQVSHIEVHLPLRIYRDPRIINIILIIKILYAYSFPDNIRIFVQKANLKLYDW